MRKKWKKNEKREVNLENLKGKGRGMRGWETKREYKKREYKKREYKKREYKKREYKKREYKKREYNKGQRTFVPWLLMKNNSDTTRKRFETLDSGTIECCSTKGPQCELSLCTK
jgi:phosphoribulokinase